MKNKLKIIAKKFGRLKHYTYLCQNNLKQANYESSI